MLAITSPSPDEFARVVVCETSRKSNDKCTSDKQFGRGVVRNNFAKSRIVRRLYTSQKYLVMLVITSPSPDKFFRDVVADTTEVLVMLVITSPSPV
jgi:hypothetical protein